MKEAVWLVITMLLLIMVVVLTMYLQIYRRNVKDLSKQIKTLLKEDTNLLLMTQLQSKDWLEMVSLLNQSFYSTKEMKKKMIRTNHSFRESITGISHDLRTPLTSAGGYVQMLKNKELDEEKRMEYIDIVYNRIRTVNDLLDQLFDYARMEAEEMELPMEKVNLTNLLCDVLSMYYQDFKERQEEPNIRMPKEDVTVWGNEEGLKRIISNILYNSLIHGEGKRSVKIEIMDDYAEFSCSNRTTTIREEDVEFLFDRFYTSDKSRNRRTTGLGLAVAKRLVDLMEGGITAELNEGRLTIRTKIPLKERKKPNEGYIKGNEEVT